MLSVLAKRLTVLSSPDRTDSGIVVGVMTVVVIALLPLIPWGETNIPPEGAKATTEFRPRWAAATRRRKREALMTTACGSEVANVKSLWCTIESQIKN